MHEHHHEHHHHGHHHHHPTSGKGLGIALTTTLVIVGAEIWGWYISNSLALLSDSGHMAGDALSLLLSLVALWLGKKGASSRYSFGYGRAEVLASLVNGILLVGYSVWIVIEALQRFVQPSQVQGKEMMWIAFIGLLANVVSAWALIKFSDVKTNLNVKSAYLHVWADMLGSVAVIGSSFFIQWLEWNWIDPFVSLLLSIVIIRGGWNVLRESVFILMEGTAKEEREHVEKHLLAIREIMCVNGVYVWNISSERLCLVCDVTIQTEAEEQQVRKQVEQELRHIKPWHMINIQIKKEA